MINKTALVVFIKNPKLGEVKTRLAKEVGDKKALQIYSLLLKHTIEVVNSLSELDVKFYINNFPNEDVFFFNNEIKFFLQEPGDLGKKMQNALDTQLEYYQNVIIIGSDCPEISSDLIHLAREKLEIFDVVLGPSRDGGYYLLGLNEMHAGIFEKMEWSTDTVSDETIRRLLYKGLNIFLLPALDDVDHAEDWGKHRHLFGF